MSARLIGALSAGAYLAAVMARAVAAAFEAMDRELGTYRVEIPSVVPLWMDEEADL